MDPTKIAAAAAGVAVGATAGAVFRANFGWSILLGSLGALATYWGVNKASGTTA